MEISPGSQEKNEKEVASDPMSESSETPELPKLLDILEVDGRWAQFLGETIYQNKGGAQELHLLVRWLNTGDSAHLRLADFTINPFRYGSVRDIRIDLTDTEYQNIHYGPETVENPDLRLEVKVWGDMHSRLDI